MIDEYLSYLQEGYLLSDRTVSVNLQDFVSGEKNKLIIVGVPGSGKTSLGQHLAKKYKANLVSDTEHKIMMKGLTDNKRTIIEGAGLTILYKKYPYTRQLIINTPMIILGMSAIKAGLRADERDGTVPGIAKKRSEIYYFVRNNLTTFQRALNRLRKDLMKLPDTNIERYDPPKFKPVYY